MPQDHKVQGSPSRDPRTNGEGWFVLFQGWPWRQGAHKPKSPPESEKLERAYDRLLDSLKAAIDDFTTMEINSVLVQNISADRPLTDLELLQQIGGDLLNWLKEHPIDGRLQQPLSEQTLISLEQLTESLGLPFGQPEAEVIQGLNHRQEVVQALWKDTASCLDNSGAHLSSPLDAEEASKCAEYRRYLRYLQKFLMLCERDRWEMDSDGRFYCRERQQLRKLWELVGTTFVYAQTVVALDGDVVSRINERLFRPTYGLTREHIDALIRFHNHNTEASAHGRNSLMAVIINTLQAVLRR
jgi:hypothetical protein